MTKLIKTSSGSNGTKTSTMSGEGEDADVVAATKQSVAELEPPDDATEMRVGAWRKWQGSMSRIFSVRRRRMPERMDGRS